MSNRYKHSQGPWAAEKPQFVAGKVIRAAAGTGEIVAHVPPSANTDKDAAVIAAAPLLLELLAQLVLACDEAATFSNGNTDPSGCYDEGDFYGWRAVNNARAAIQAITGEEL